MYTRESLILVIITYMTISRFTRWLSLEKSDGLYYRRIGSPDATTAVIFLHGLAGSRRQWSNAYTRLPKNYAAYFVDLLGFGYSVKPHDACTLGRHIRALHTFIQGHVGEKHLVFVGYSLGAIIALGYTAVHPEFIDKTILLALPYYTSRKEAISHIRQHTKPSYFALDSPLTKLICKTVCYYGGPITRRIAPFLLWRLPPAVASDTFLHTYNSYISTLYSVVYGQNIPALLHRVKSDQIILVHGDKDDLAPLANVQKLAEVHNLALHIMCDAAHTFPITKSTETQQVILQTLAR